MGYNGFKAKLNFANKEMAIATEVKFRKVETVDFLKDIEIVMRDPDNKIVKRKSTDALTGKPSQFGYRFLNEDGKEISKDKVRYFAKKGEKETEVRPYKRTDTIQVQGEIPADREHEFLVESIYELWATEENKDGLWKLADYLHKNGLMGVSKFSFGNGFKQSFVLLKPVVQGDKFLFQMNLTQKKKDYKNYMTVPSKDAVKLEAVPTIEEIMGDAFA